MHPSIRKVACVVMALQMKIEFPFDPMVVIILYSGRESLVGI